MWLIVALLWQIFHILKAGLVHSREKKGIINNTTKDENLIRGFLSSNFEL